MYKAWDRKMCNNYDTQDDREDLFNTLLVVVNLSFKFAKSFLFFTNENSYFSWGGMLFYILVAW